MAHSSSAWKPQPHQPQSDLDQLTEQDKQQLAHQLTQTKEQLLAQLHQARINYHTAERARNQALHSLNRLQKLADQLDQQTSQLGDGSHYYF